MEDDKKLWAMATTGIKPLKNKKPLRIDKAASKPVRHKNPGAIIEIAPASPIRPHKKEISQGFFAAGDMSHVDGSAAQKLKAGEYPVEATLDLHGKTKDEAFEALRYFLATSYSMGKRCILVITGKGVEGTGVLRENFPKWLNTAGMREYILAYTHAAQNHGGSGAFYVLLRKR